MEKEFTDRRRIKGHPVLDIPEPLTAQDRATIKQLRGVTGKEQRRL